MRRALAVCVALCALTAGACGAPDELSRSDGEQLAAARVRIESAVETERRLRSSPRAAERIVARVREIVSTGALEARRLDEFGLAALGELRLVVPSLVIVDRIDVPRELDRPALAAFLANARTDPAGALRRPVVVEVARVGDVLESADAGPDTAIPVADQTAGDYLSRLESTLAEPYPALADEVASIRADL